MTVTFRLDSVCLDTAAGDVKYSFPNDLTVPSGETGVGKTILLELIKFGLGGDGHLLPVAVQHVTDVHVSIHIGDRQLQLSRGLDAERRRTVRVVDLASGDRMRDHSVAGEDPTISDLLLSAMGLESGMRAAARGSRSTSAGTRITFNDIFHFMYVPQAAMNRDIAQSERGYYDPKRRAVFELLFGLTSSQVLKMRSDVNTLKSSIDDANRDAVTIQQFLADTGLTSRFDAELNLAQAVLQANPVQPARITDEFNVDSSTSPATGVYLYSLNRNVAGNARVTLDVPAGTSVRIRYGEKLSNGRVAVVGTRFQDDTFISDGSGPATWTPQFSYKGFEYVEISGLPAEAAAPKVTVLRIHNDIESVGAFDSSDDVLNFVHTAGRSTVLNNLVVGVPTDGSYIEKLPWLGDAAVMAEANMRNFDTENVYVKYYNDLADSQSANGDMPAWAPSPTRGAELSSAGWGNAFTEVALLLLHNHQAAPAVEARYEKLKRYVSFLATVAETPRESWGD